MAFMPAIHETDLSKGVCICAPPANPYQAAAHELRTALERATGAAAEVVLDDETPADGRHVIALGNMMDSDFLRELYDQAYDMTDYAWPGPGGWVIRTVPHSGEGVGHVLVVGVSAAQDILGAVRELGQAVDEGSGRLEYQYRVKLGRWGELSTGLADEWLERADTDLEVEYRTGAGDWNYMNAISEIGMLAVHTGREGLIDLFCEQIRLFAERRWFERDLPDPPQIHGFLRNLLIPFSILENHPVLSRTLRQDTLDILLALHRSAEGAGNRGFLAHVGTDRVRQNHQTRSGLDIFYGGRYFHQVHGLAEGLGWMKLAEVFFAPQMTSNKPVCDSWGHQWSASLFNTADYALASGKKDYFTSGPYLEGADRALIAHGPLQGGPTQYLLMAAAVTGNNEYLWPCSVSDEDGLIKRALRGREAPLRSWVTGREAAEPSRLSGSGVAPLSRLFYDSMEDYGGLAPAGVYQREVPYEATFDKVYFRSGWSRDDDYLLLDGVSGGSHSYQDGNCIVSFTSKGQNWFGSRVGPASVRDHVGVSIAVDGAGPGCESRYASLRYRSVGAVLSAVGTEMACPEQGNWHRHVIHSETGWFLVVDEVWARTAGDFLVEARWHVLGNVELSGGVLRSTQGDACLTMQHLGSAEQVSGSVGSALIKGGTRWTQRSLVPLRRNEGVRFATLFWVDRGENVRAYVLTSDASGYRVDGEDEGVSVALSPDIATPTMGDGEVVLPASGTATAASDAAPFSIQRRESDEAWGVSCEGPVASTGVWEDGGFAGDNNGGITAFDREGRTLWTRRLSGGIRAVCGLQDGGVVAGGDAETLHRLDASGNEVWSKQLEWQAMNWDYWTWMNTMVLSLASADVTGDGRDEILAGCADRHVYTFDADGNLLWRSACQWGPPTCLGVADLGDPSVRLVLAGSADPSIFGCIRAFDAEGACVQTLSRPDIMCWSVPSWSKCLRVADVDGDGRDEVISGVDTNHRQLIVYGNDGEVRWDADLGGAVLSVEVLDGRILAGAENGYVQRFDADGGRIWSRFLAEPVVGLAPHEVGGCRVALRDGSVVALGADGDIAASSDGTARTTAAVWAPHWGEGVMLVGGKDGVVRCFG
ncbi:MAG: hypothetical protein QGI83_16100 [Candidatus Latescibacteria bacterium]|nr:hypothetical protein [Candidatus Latescibacterota bacterium]